MSNTKKIIYLDNASTSWPKPTSVIESINDYFVRNYNSPNRSNVSANIVEEVRLQVAKYFSAEKNYNVAFVPSATIGINIVLNTLLNNGDHVITTNCEHNCVYRTLEYLKHTKGIEYTIAKYIDEEQNEHKDRILNAIKTNTKMIIMNHASNVTGTIFNVMEIGSIIKNSQIVFVVDISQTSGYLNISMPDFGADVMFSSTHKHLYGIPGLGFILYNNKIQFKPFICGGTGNNSYLLKQPTDGLDVIEVGTANVPAMLALKAGMEFCSSANLKTYYTHNKKLLNLFIENCKSIKGVSLYIKSCTDNTGILPFEIEKFDPSFIISPYLAKNNVIVRSGLHCAPEMHKAIGTYPMGLTRASLSVFNSEDDINKLCELIENITRSGANGI